MGTLRRHVATIKNKEGKRIVGYSGAKGGITAGRILRGKNPNSKIKSYSSPVPRAIVGARTAQRAFSSKSQVRLRKELGEMSMFKNPEKTMKVVEKKYKNNEIAARNAWLKGSTLEGSLYPSKKVAADIIRRRLGLELAIKAGKAGLGTKGNPRSNVVLDNVTHSWIVESVIKELTAEKRKKPRMKTSPKENTGAAINFVKQKNGKFRVKLRYEEFSGDVTNRFSKFMLPSVKKYLDI